MGRYFITALALLYCSQIFAQATGSNIAISGIDNQYSSHKYFRFNLKNNGNKEAFAGVSLEQQSKGEWVEILDDIFKNKSQLNSKIAIVAVLAAGETRAVKWKPVWDLPKNMNFRLKVTYFYHPHDKESFTYSEQFHVPAGAHGL